MTIAPARATSPTILIVDNPKVPSHQYRLVGKIKYQDVTGDGYLEMLSYFPKQGAFFSRDLEPDGVMGKITGTSDWREFQVPFYSKPGVLPNRLVVNLVLPESKGKLPGTVWISPMKLEAVEPPVAMEYEDQASSPFSWPLFAAIFSGLVGVLGTLVALFAGNPATRRPAFFLTMLLIPCSFAALLAGVVGWSQESGQNGWYPSIVVGGSWMILFVVAAVVLRRKLAREELRRMQALDASVR